MALVTIIDAEGNETLVHTSQLDGMGRAANPPQKDQPMNDELKDLRQQIADGINDAGSDFVDANPLASWADVPDVVFAQAALQAIKDAGYVIVPKEPGTEGAAKPLPDDQGWIQHRGAEQPVPDGVRVDLRLSDGSVVEGVWSDDWGWDWGETDPQILAYRASQREGDGK